MASVTFEGGFTGGVLEKMTFVLTFSLKSLITVFTLMVQSAVVIFNVFSE